MISNSIKAVNLLKLFGEIYGKNTLNQFILKLRQILNDTFLICLTLPGHKISKVLDASQVSE